MKIQKLKKKEKIVLEVLKESILNIVVKTQKLRKKGKIIPEISKENFLNQRVKMIPINRAAKKIEIVKYILFLISEENSYTTGQTISISGGE